MRRLILLAALLLVSAPGAVAGQVSLLAGAGLSTPIGDFGDVAEAGWHGMVGMQLGVPAIPIALRGEGAYHSFGAATGNPSSSILDGTLSLVVNLPGVGLVPYLLAGLGTYRTSFDQAGSSASVDNGFHGAFGVNIGALGFGGFGEVRLVNVSGSGGDTRFITATLGLRL